jgi:hypothetical protein
LRGFPLLVSFCFCVQKRGKGEELQKKQE